MSYRAFLGVLIVLPFLVLAVLYTAGSAGSLEAAGQGQTPPNSPPEFGKTKITLSVTENAAAGDFGEAITATDVDNNTLTYSILTMPRGPFEINRGTGQLRTTEPLNYEAMSIHQTPSYMLTYYYLDIGVSDGSADDYISVEVKVKDVEEDGVVDLLWDQPQVGTPIVASLTDPDGEVSGVTWQWDRSQTKEGTFTDITTNGTSATYTPVDADNGNYLRATALYTDRRGPEKSANGVSDHQSRAIPDDNTAPTITGDTSVEIKVNENTPAGAHLGDAFQATDTDPDDDIRYFLGVTDDDGAFDIDPESGQLKVKAPLNHELKETYSLSVFARDPTRAGALSESTGTVTVTITVTDINERPKVSGDFDPEYQENSESLLVTTLTGVDEDRPKGGSFHRNYYVSWLVGGLSGSDGHFFYMDDDSDDGHLKFRVPPDFDNPADRNRDNVYDISMTAYTGKYDMTYFNVSVTVTDGNDDGVVMGPSSVSFPEGAERSVATYTISGTTQQTISWSVTGADRNQFTIDGGVLNFKSPPDYNSPSNYDRNNKYSITVTAHGPNVTAAMNVVVTVTEHNFPPVISGPDNPTFAENGTGTVATYSATDEDEDPITWSLAGVDAGDLSIHSSDGTLTFRSPPDFEGAADDDTNNDYDVTVQAYDRTVTVDYPVTVTVTNVNEAPSFGAQTTTRSVDENTATGQDIGAPVEATDVDANDSLTYSLDSASTAVFDIDSNGQLKTKAALDHETQGQLQCDCDGAGQPRSHREHGSVTINVGDVNEAPKFPSSTATREVAENIATNQEFGDPVEATDQDDGDSMTYSMEGTDVSSFDIDSGTGQLKTLAGLDHTDRDSYLVTVVATDLSSAEGKIDVTITVTDVNEAPAFPDSETGARSIPENTAAGQNIGDAVAAEDPDDGDTLTYSLDETAAASFEIDTSTGQLKTKAALDYEGGTTSYTVTVSVHDGKDANGDADTTVDATQDVTITVTDENETIDLTGDANPDYPENGTGAVATYTATDGDGGTIIWNLSGDDAARFDFVGGVLTFKSSPDYEMPTDQGPDNKYQVTVEASTLNDTPATLAVTITVTDVNEPPAFDTATTSRSVSESASTGDNIGDAVDADDPDAGATLTYTLGGTDASSFSIVVSSGQLQVKDALDFETKPSHEVTVSVRDSKDDSGNADTDDDDTTTVTITVTDANDAPTFNSGPTTTIEVAENTVAGTDIGDAFTATDQDTGDTVTYSLDATSAAVFDIDDNGQLKTKGPLDYERKTSYTVTVSVSDSKAADGTTDTATDASITVTVNVSNLAEDGTITLSSRQPQVGTAFTATLSDPNIASPVVTWAWEKSTDKALWTVIASAEAAAYTPVDWRRRQLAEGYCYVRRAAGE